MSVTFNRRRCRGDSAHSHRPATATRRPTPTPPATMQCASTHGESAHQDQHVRMMEDMSAETRRHGVETALNLPREQALSHAASFVVLLADSDCHVRNEASFALCKLLHSSPLLNLCARRRQLLQQRVRNRPARHMRRRASARSRPIHLACTCGAAGTTPTWTRCASS